MRILYTAFKYDYGDPARGYSYEHFNFYESLLHMGHDIMYFDLGTLFSTYGRAGLSKRLLEVAQSEQPDLLFASLQKNELDPTAVSKISTDLSTVTVNWFSDDHWRFESFSRHLAGHFNWVVTTAKSALPKYRALGFPNVIKSQWACNTLRYFPLGTPQIYDVTFVGLPHGDRRFIIEALHHAGIRVLVWGNGWENGRIDQDAMIRVFNESKINLNLSNSSPPQTLAGRFIDAAIREVERAPITARVRNQTATRLAVLRHYLAKSGSPTFPDQIKGRNFEVPGCGGFLLTGQADNLEDYYAPGKEVACFIGVDDLVAQVRHYLRDQDQRQAIATAGYERTLREHTYIHRFAEIFERISLPTLPDADVSASRSSPGRTEDVS
jgi:spore maturation protein CgeB